MIKLKMIQLDTLTVDQREVLAKKLLQEFQHEVKILKLEYIKKRFQKYTFLTMAEEGDEIVGFLFSYKASVKLIIEIPQMHIGLTLIKRKYRQNGLVRKLCRKTFKSFKKLHLQKTFLCGLIISSKCSSPVSFKLLSNACFGIYLPKIHKEGLFWRKIEQLAQKLLLMVRSNLSLSLEPEFILKKENFESGFLLQKESYKAKTQKEIRIINYFQKNITPLDEIIFLTWIPPGLLCFV